MQHTFKPLAHNAPMRRIPSTKLCVYFQTLTPKAGVKGVYFIQYIDPHGDTWPRRAVAVGLDDTLRVLDTTENSDLIGGSFGTLPVVHPCEVQDVITLVEIYTAIARWQQLAA